MQDSEGLGAGCGLIYQKIPLMIAEVGHIAKGKRNEQQRFMYRGVDDVYAAVQPMLSKHGVFITTTVEDEIRGEGTTKNGGNMFYARLHCRFRFYATDGSFVESMVVGEAQDSGDKSSPKALSIAYKYALFQLLCIPTEETACDPDATSESMSAGTTTNAIKTAPTKPVSKAPPAGSKETLDIARVGEAFANAKSTANLAELVERAMGKATRLGFSADQKEPILAAASKAGATPEMLAKYRPAAKEAIV